MVKETFIHYCAEITMAVKVLNGLRAPLRRDLYQVLSERGQMTVTELVNHFETIDQSQISTYLKWLRDVGLVVSKSEGRFTIYKCCPDRLEQLYQLSLIINNKK